MGGRTELGRRGEDAAAAHLAAKGLQVVARNWRCRHGEIDIVASEGGTLVFCEVKTRSGLGFGSPLSAITPVKQARLRRLVGVYLADSGGHPGPVRIDAVGILWHPGQEPDVIHLRGVA
jgi:putative endonuclease